MGRRRLEEFPVDSLEAIENGIVMPTCRSCGAKQRTFVRMHTVKGMGQGGLEQIETGVRTQNQIGGCTNAKCHRYINPAVIKHWVPVESTAGR